MSAHGEAAHVEGPVAVDIFISYIIYYIISYIYIYILDIYYIFAHMEKPQTPRGQ